MSTIDKEYPINRHLLSQLAHVEILSPRPAETVTFFEQQLGLEITTHVGQSSYLRGCGEFFHHSIKVTASAQPGLGHIGWRAENAEALLEGVRLLQQHLGFRYHDGAILDGTDQELTAFLAVTAHHHDLGLIRDPVGARGRLNHVAFSLDTREEVMRAADVMRDNNDTINEFGPGRHAGGGSFFLYLREPGGNRIELYSGEALILAPDWEPVRWLASENPMRSPNRLISNGCNSKRSKVGTLQILRPARKPEES